MRTMLNITIPVETGNRAIKDNVLPKVMGGFSEEHHPESAYFYADGEGRRHAQFVFDLKDPSQIPAIAEPFFMQLNAAIEFHPVMNAEDLQKGLQIAAKKF